MNTSIRLVSLNVSLFDDNNKKISRFLTDINADIICLQEASRKVDNHSFDEFITKDAVDEATSKLAYSFYSPNWALKDFRQENFHGKEIFEHDFGGVIEYGNYIRSKFKVVAGKSVFIQGTFSYLTDWKTFQNHPGEEPRMVQVTDLEIGTKKIRVLNYHGIWTKDKKDTDRKKYASEILIKLASEVTCPTIICGDFNLFPDTESIKILNRKFTSLVDEFNISSTRPKSNELSTSKRNVVDYIFVSKTVVVKKFEVINTDVSDHLPLLLDFQITEDK